MAEYDLLILGAGTSGLPTSRVAASQGKKVLLIGKKPIGGKCVNYGCTPTKFLVYVTKLYKEALKAKDFGIKTGSVEINFTNAMDLTRNLVQESLNQNEERLANIDNIEFIPKLGKFVNDTDVQIERETFSAKCNLIATGARNFTPPIKGIDEVEFLTPKSVWGLKTLPKSIGFIGGGFISCEFASIFNTFGSRVSIFEQGPRIIGRADELISKNLKNYFIEDNIKIYNNIGIEAVKNERENIVLELNSGESVRLKKLMVATGTQGNTETINAEAANIKIDQRGYIVIDNFLKTSNPNVWAIGDVVGKQQFTHMALKESKAVIQNMFGDKQLKIRFDNIPYAAFTDPPIGSIGKTEQQLKAENVPFEVAQTELPKCSRGFIMKLKRGHVKILHNNKEIFGCHIIGENADNLVHEIVPLVGLPNGWEIFNDTIHAHPTLAEIFTNLQN